MAWPTVEEYHPDAYALNILAAYLSRGKNAPLYRVLVEDKKLTAGVRTGNYASELAGQFMLSVRAFQDKDLDEVAKAIQSAFTLFEKEGLPQKDLDRIKAGLETQFYNSLSSVQGKGVQLVKYNIFAGDPGFFEKDFNNLLKVTTNDVIRVYNKYIKGKNYVATSFVPKGKPGLALEGSKRADVVEEQIAEDAPRQDAVDPSAPAVYERAPSAFDRSKEPPYGPAPEVNMPEVWEEQLGNGLRIYAIENNEVPLVQFELVMDGGLLLEDIEKVGVSNLLARMMTQGTKRKTPRQLEEAIEQLGATINVNAGDEDIRINVNTLAKHYDATLALLEEILLEPRWDAAEFDLVKQSTISQIRQQEANPNNIADNQYNRLIFGKDNIRSRNILGTVASINAISLKDLQDYYNKNISPSLARMHIVGAVNINTIKVSLDGLAKNWKTKPVTIPTPKSPEAPTRSVVYFYDVPDAKQTVVRIGYPAMAATDSDFYPATVMNYILGGGGFASQLTQQLREGKGYTYGIRSSFEGTGSKGLFPLAAAYVPILPLKLPNLYIPPFRTSVKIILTMTWKPQKVFC
jgi:zinc protease